MTSFTGPSCADGKKIGHHLIVVDFPSSDIIKSCQKSKGYSEIAFLKKIPKSHSFSTKIAKY